ncbi:hypothetical protein [Paenarthrobacter ureafaciens]|uniref:hypothetical protein n=2 Tax=Paenarthrobacter ureafaciens TaxID=37931 RepID=UPI002DBA1FA3|nr:hypothetical protein [Paenarthrobacter ureafaciens]
MHEQSKQGVKMKQFRTVLATAAVGLSLGAGTLVAAAPAHADYNTYQVVQSTNSACATKLRAAIQAYGGKVTNVTACHWNKYQQKYIGSFGYNY